MSSNDSEKSGGKSKLSLDRLFFNQASRYEALYEQIENLYSVAPQQRRLSTLAWWNWSHDQLHHALSDFRTLPLSLIRAHEPYIDTEPLSVAPLKPGDEKEFRLIFESVPGNWNQMLPEIHVVKVTSL